MTTKPTASFLVAAKKKLLSRIAAEQRHADAAKKTAKAAKQEFRKAKQKAKEAKRAAKKFRKSVKALKAELAALSVKKPARKAAPRKPAVKRERSAAAAVIPEPVAPADVVPAVTDLPPAAEIGTPAQ